MAEKRKKKVEDPQDALMDTLKRCKPDEGMWDLAMTDEEALSQVDYVLFTGIKAFDDIVGGMPFGRIVEVFGLESCGKTATAIRCAAKARKKDIKRIVRDDDDTKKLRFEELNPDDIDVMVCYIDNEGSLDMDGKLMFENEPIRVTNFRCDTTENMLKAVDKTLDAAERWQEDHPQRKLFTVIIIDTITSTTTEKDLKAKWDAMDYPRQPQQISRGMARLVRRVNTLNACLICTNQVRAQFKTAGPGKRPSFGIQASDYRASGAGFALRFYATHRVFMYATEMKYRLTPTAKFAAGLQIGFHTVKNRVRTPLRDGRMVLLFDKVKGGLNDDFSILETLLFLGFIECLSKEKGINFVLKFKKHGIIPETFNTSDVTTSLDEDDDEVTAPKRGSGSRKDPTFKLRSEWPVFLNAHRADVEKLWDAAVDYVMSTPGLDGGITVEETDEDSEENGD